MTAMQVLKGMTWSDPRGYDPLIALSTVFGERNAGVSISWDTHSLQGFESTPVDQLATDYDLLIIDHPHVGAAARQGCLLALDDWLPEETISALANESVGKSFVSYAIDGRQWALPIDAATQVQAHRPDLGDRVRTWQEIKQVAREGAVVLPLRPPHSLMCLFTLAGNIGHPCGSYRDRLLADEILTGVFSELKAVTDTIDPSCFGLDPIAAMDRLADGKKLRIAPLIYFYKGYSDAGYRANRLAFSDMPTLGPFGPVGSALGGTGLAISSRTRSPELCARFAAWATGAECQSELYAASNGQPGNAVAWASEHVNEPVLGAYWNTRLTHEAAWLRPRHDGYVAFQAEGAEIVNDALKGSTTVPAAIDALNRSFAASFARSDH